MGTDAGPTGGGPRHAGGGRAAATGATGGRTAERAVPRAPWLPLIAAAVIVPAVLAGLTLLWPRPQIEGALTERAQAALAAAGISGATVRFDGRDATVTGLTDAAAAQAVQVVEQATGVRVAVAGLSPGSVPTLAPLPAPPPPPTPAPAAPAPVPTAGVTPAPTPLPAQAGELDASAKQTLQARITALAAAAPITFGPDSPQLTAEGAATLAQVLAVVRAAPGARLQIDGYVATGRGNGLLTAQQLSDQRAVAVRDALVAGGVPADHLASRGRGEDTAATDRALGRRVEITVV